MKENKRNDGRVRWLDGVKGAACMCVVLVHYVAGFYPALYYGSAGREHIGRFPGLETTLAEWPTLILKGHFLVCLFCVVSGIVLSLKVIRAQDKGAAAAEIVAGRYFRMAIPIFFIQLLIWGMYRLRMFVSATIGPEIVGHPWLSGFFTAPFSLADLFVNSFIEVEFVGKSLMGVTWMISDLFIGGILSVALSLLALRGKRGAKILCALWGAGLLSRGNLYASFPLGTLLALLMEDGWGKRSGLKNIAFLAAGGGGWILGSYPEFEPTRFYRLLMVIRPAGTGEKLFWHQIGAFLLLLSISYFRLPQRLFESKPFQFLGKISFSVYLVHFPILCSFSSWLFLRLLEAGLSYNRAALAMFTATAPLLIVCSWLFYRYVERFSYGLGRTLLRKITDLDKND